MILKHKHPMTTKYFEFIDRLFGFIYEWVLKILTMFLGTFVLEVYMPGLLKFASEEFPGWFVTVVLASAVLAFIQLAVEPIVAGLWNTQNAAEDEESEEEPAEVTKVSTEAEPVQ